MTTPSPQQPEDRPSRSGSAPVLRSLKVLTGGITGGIVLMGVALAFLLDFTAPALWAVLVLLIVGIGAHTVIRAVGYRAKPIPPQTPTGEAGALSIRAFRSLMMLRMALAESVAIIAIPQRRRAPPRCTPPSTPPTPRSCALPSRAPCTAGNACPGSKRRLPTRP